MPVYNEQDVIGTVLKRWDAALSDIGIDYEIRPYNDGSKDDSLALMQDLARHHEHISVRDKTNGGHGNAILTGYREAAADGFDWIFQIDSDDEIGPEKFRELWGKRNGCDFLVGTSDGRMQALTRKIGGFISRLCVRLFYGKSVCGVDSSYRLMRVSVFEEFFNEIPLTTFAPNVILSGLAARHKLRVFELRVPQHHRATGVVSVKRGNLLKDAITNFCQAVEFSVSQACIDKGWNRFVVLAVLSTLLKIISSARGWNFDFESYNIVANIVNGGGNVYAETVRYNYGPPWFLLLGFIKSLMGGCFRLGIISLLCLADIGIAALLWRRKLFIPVILFLCSNVSIHISGCHNQFDNVALAIALLALELMDKTNGIEFKRRTYLSCYWLGVILLGVSITIKHIFVFFPFWFLFRSMGKTRRLFSFLLPLIIFISSFVPYSGLTDATCARRIVESAGRIPEYVKGSSLKAGLKQCYEKEIKPLKLPAHGIVKNVFMYRSSEKGSVYDILFPDCVLKILPTTLIFFVCMVFLGFLSRKKSWFECFLIYTLGMFVFSPGMAMQYYAVPAISAAVCWCPFGFLYHLGVGSVFLIRQGGGTMLPIVIAPSLLMAFGCMVMALRKKY